MDRRSAAARAAFDAACGKAAMAISDKPGAARMASAGWVELTGRRDETMRSRGRMLDATLGVR